MPHIDLTTLPVKELLPGFEVKFVHTDEQTFAFWNIQKGGELPEHHHPHQQTAIVQKGSFEMTVDGDTNILTPGHVMVIPSNVPHSGKALTDCEIMDVFYPVREDYL